MRVSEVMTKNPETLLPDSSIQEIAREMEKLDCGFMPIAENGRLLGTITDRDLVMRVLAKGKNPQDTTAEEIMTPEVVHILKDQDLEDAAQEMCKRQIRRLVVVDNNEKICGVLSLGDIATKCNDHEIDAEIITSVSEKY